MAAEKEAITWRAAGPSPQHPRARGEHPGRVAEHEAQRMRDLGRQKGTRIALQDLVKDHGGAREAPLDRLAQGLHKRALIRRSARDPLQGSARIRMGLACRGQEFLPGQDQVGEAL